MLRKNNILSGVFFSVLFLYAISSVGSETVDQEIENTINKIRSGVVVTAGNMEQRFLKLLPDFYQSRQYRRSWTDSKKIASLIQNIGNAAQHGLLAQDYHLKALEFLHKQADKSNSELALLDLIATDALILFTQHLLHGKVDPERLYPKWNLTRSVEIMNLLAAINKIIPQESIGEWFNRIQPDFPIYRRMKAALVQYKSLTTEGNWPVFEGGRLLKQGMRDSRVPSLRRRLSMTDANIASTPKEHELYDPQLEQLLRKFQRRHGLKADGIVGPTTRAALNVSPQQRINQLRVNLERARWVLHNIQERTVVVNIAGFSLYIADGKEAEWKTRVVVGRTYRKTPVFKSQISHLILNPSWTVPTTIFFKDILPEVIEQPEALQHHGLKVVDLYGKVIDPKKINWERYKTEHFPYRLRQDPGSGNALGRVKFIFPNPYMVYMHDTPNRELFDQPKRTFSSGCIRVDKPFELAVRLLNDPMRWSEQRLIEQVETGQTKVIHLPEPVDILVMYWTAGVDFEGVVHFRNDVYNRDPAVLHALNKPFIPAADPSRRF